MVTQDINTSNSTNFPQRVRFDVRRCGDLLWSPVIGIFIGDPEVQGLISVKKYIHAAQIHTY